MPRKSDTEPPLIGPGPRMIGPRCGGLVTECLAVHIPRGPNRADWACLAPPTWLPWPWLAQRLAGGREPSAGVGLARRVCPRGRAWLLEPARGCWGQPSGPTCQS